MLFSKEGKDVEVDFSKYNIPKGSTFQIIDIENPDAIIKSGKVNKDSKIIVPMALKEFDLPLHNTKAQKTLDNFGVFIIEFK